MTERLQLTAERAPFVMLPRWLLYHRDVGEGAKFLYCVLHDLVAGREGPTRPVTRAELAGRCGVSANTIDRRLAELVAVGAVEKEPQILAGGQVGNIYRVWLTHPDQRLASRLPTNGEPRSERFPIGEDPVLPAEVVVDNRLPTAGEARSGRLIIDGEPPRPWGGSLLNGGDPNGVQEPDQERPPQPPRRAGGPAMDTGQAGTRLVPMAPGVPPEGPGTDSRPAPSGPVPRPPALPGDGAPPATGRRSRGLGTNPRAEADRAEQARRAAEAEARRAELERTTESRRAAERAAARESDRLEAEALAVSAALDDSTLAEVVAAVRPAMSGPLAASAMAVARAVVNWCRSAASAHGGELADAVTAGLIAGTTATEGTPPALGLPAAPAGTASLRARVAGLMHPGGR